MEREVSLVDRVSRGAYRQEEEWSRLSVADHCRDDIGRGQHHTVGVRIVFSRSGHPTTVAQLGQPPDECSGDDLGGSFAGILSWRFDLCHSDRL